MRYYLDTEFNGFGGALLSLALVPDDGEEFYVTLECAEPAQRKAGAKVANVDELIQAGTLRSTGGRFPKLEVV